MEARASLPRRRREVMADKQNAVGFSVGNTSGIGPTYRRVLAEDHKLAIILGAVGTDIPDDIDWNAGLQYNYDFTTFRTSIGKGSLFVTGAARVAGSTHQMWLAPPEPIDGVRPAKGDPGSTKTVHETSVAAGVGVGAEWGFNFGLFAALSFPMVNVDVVNGNVGVSYWPNLTLGYEF
jgi:hypothetical protein